MRKRQRPNLNKDLTADYLSDRLDVDRAEGKQRFNQRSKFADQMRTLRTRAEQEATNVFDDLPAARVLEVHGLFCTIEPLDGEDRTPVHANVRKTLQKTSSTRAVVGDVVRYRRDTSGGVVVEQIRERETVLLRADSFKAQQAWPIVANAHQMLIVASPIEPRVKWGLIDRMTVAAQTGGLRPIVCMNKIDLIEGRGPSNERGDDEGRAHNELTDVREKLAHYRSLGIACFETSVAESRGLDTLRDALRGQTTVLAGHSGVGKSSLVRAVDPRLDIRVGDISHVHQKGKHTTTSARIYRIDAPELRCEVIDTPGVKLFGLWDVDVEKLESFFPDVAAGTAPEWRVESLARMVDSLGGRKP